MCVMASQSVQHDARHCDKHLVLAFGFLGKRWNGIILGTLAEGPAGFAEIRRSLGQITDSVLSDRLAELTAGGLVSRKITDSRPPGVLYELTAAGHGLTPVLDDLAQWAAANFGGPPAPADEPA